ncbi:hypothetical protein PVK06_027539 [Gossypium arboreum]|uniref:Uncharacterized protein n=1 Tax=Gossypium arboreum TaxID=29729 RepID=A0ABR0P0J1_GOSAR|nr:hypothetical protein PVK06_027539 [Gossypium arboreum]
MTFLASVRHQAYVFPLVNRWSTNLGIGRLYTVPIYRLMIEQHAGEGSSGITRIEYSDSLVTSSIFRLRQCSWGRFTGLTREENMEIIGSPSHMYRLEAYELEPEPKPELEPESKPEPEPEPELEPEPERSHTHSWESSYHLKLQVNDYFPGLSGHGYHSGFDIFSLVPL